MLLPNPDLLYELFDVFITLFAFGDLLIGGAFLLAIQAILEHFVDICLLENC